MLELLTKIFRPRYWAYQLGADALGRAAEAAKLDLAARPELSAEERETLAAGIDLVVDRGRLELAKVLGIEAAPSGRER